jgi:hypothetical protein
MLPDIDTHFAEWVKNLTPDVMQDLRERYDTRIDKENYPFDSFLMDWHEHNVFAQIGVYYDQE